MTNVKQKVEGLLGVLGEKDRSVEASAVERLADSNVDALKKFLVRLSNDADNAVADSATLALDDIVEAEG